MEYIFVCSNEQCNDTLEIECKISKFDEMKERVTCPRCSSKMNNKIFANAFHLKGSGWASDGYK